MKQKWMFFLEFSCFLHDPTDIGNLISVFSASSKPSLYIWKFSVHVLLKPNLKDFEHNLASMWKKCNCMVIWSLVPLPFLNPACTDFIYCWKFSVCVLLKPNLKDFEHYLASMWNEYNCVVVWTFFDIALLWNWNENLPFPVLWPLLSFPKLLAYWVQHSSNF